MPKYTKYTLGELSDELWIYFNWSINALVPINLNGAENYLKIHKDIVKKVSQMLLKQIKYFPTEIYRGVLLKTPINTLEPHPDLQYLSFTEDIKVARFFADVDGFGSGNLNLNLLLGEFGHIIKYKPDTSEILFHHDFLDILPYREALAKVKIIPQGHVEWLKEQKEITIIQPEKPFTKIFLHKY